MRYTQSLAIASRHDRLIDLIRSGQFSSPNLAQRLSVSEQTIYRDIDFLKERGYPICAVRLTKGWAYKLIEDSASDVSRKGASTR